MPKGHLGGPRPGSTSSLNISIEINAPEGDIDDMLVKGATRRFGKIDTLTITEDTDVISRVDETFNKVVIEILLDSNHVQLIEVEDLVNDIEQALGEERIGVEIEAV